VTEPLRKGGGKHLSKTLRYSRTGNFNRDRKKRKKKNPHPGLRRRKSKMYEETSFRSQRRSGPSPQKKKKKDGRNCTEKERPAAGKKGGERSTSSAYSGRRWEVISLAPVILRRRKGLPATEEGGTDCLRSYSAAEDHLQTADQKKGKV